MGIIGTIVIMLIALGLFGSVLGWLDKRGVDVSAVLAITFLSVIVLGVGTAVYSTWKVAPLETLTMIENTKENFACAQAGLSNPTWKYTKTGRRTSHRDFYCADVKGELHPVLMK